MAPSASSTSRKNSWPCCPSMSAGTALWASTSGCSPRPVICAPCGLRHPFSPLTSRGHPVSPGSRTATGDPVNCGNGRTVGGRRPDRSVMLTARGGLDSTLQPSLGIGRFTTEGLNPGSAPLTSTRLKVGVSGWFFGLLGRARPGPHTVAVPSIDSISGELSVFCTKGGPCRHRSHR